MPCQNGSPCALNPLAVLSCATRCATSDDSCATLRSCAVQLCSMREPLTGFCAGLRPRRSRISFMRLLRLRGSGIVSTSGSPQCEICECETEYAERALQSEQAPRTVADAKHCCPRSSGHHGGAGEAAGAVHTDRARPIKP